MHNKKSLKVLPSILKSVRYDEEVYVYDTPSLTPLKKPLKGERLCGYCGSTATTYVGDESYGSNAGGRDHEEFHCQQCKKYTVYLRDWG